MPLQSITLPHGGNNSNQFGTIVIGLLVVTTLGYMAYRISESNNSLTHKKDEA